MVFIAWRRSMCARRFELQAMNILTVNSWPKAISPALKKNTHHISVTGVFSLVASLENFINQPVRHRFFRVHEIIAICIGLDLLE